MLRIFKNKRAQSTLEYALLISVVIAALIAIQVYMKRGVMGKLKESTDQVGEQWTPENNFTRTWTISSSGPQSQFEDRTRGDLTEANATTGMLFTNSTLDSATVETLTRDEDETWGTAPAKVY